MRSVRNNGVAVPKHGAQLFFSPVNCAERELINTASTARGTQDCRCDEFGEKTSFDLCWIVMEVYGMVFHMMEGL